MCMNKCNCCCNRSLYWISAEERVLMKLGTDSKIIMKEIKKSPISYSLFKLLVEQEEKLMYKYC